MPPRARGAVQLGSKRLRQRSVLDGLRQSGSFKCLFPRTTSDALEAVLLNTAGGITGGDAFDLAAQAGAGTTLTLTTQACERAYQAQPGPYGQVRNQLAIGPGARLNWLPQETILFEGSALDRQLRADLAEDASLLLVEPMVFGRAAMGERLNRIRLRDRIEIRRAGRSVFLDAMRFAGDLSAHLARPHVANGAGAMALIVFAAASAEAQLDPVRRMLTDSAGASLLDPDLLVIRILAADSFELRRAMLPVLRRLNPDPLPRCWMI
ncbi:urease accessory protein UreD [Leisingera sp.]|uniref:urease accessory protein UreD n=1 Tax=Leisingera sp. TaxID=1879318 RepID=UPI003A8D190B